MRERKEVKASEVKAGDQFFSKKGESLIALRGPRRGELIGATPGYAALLHFPLDEIVYVEIEE